MNTRDLILSALRYKFGEDFEIALHTSVAGISKIQIVDTKIDLSLAVSVNEGEIESVKDVNGAEEFAQKIFLRAQGQFPHLCGLDENLVPRAASYITKVADEYRYSTVYNLVGVSPNTSIKFIFTNYDSGHVFIVEFPHDEFTRDNFKNIISNVTDRLKEMTKRDAAAKEALREKKEVEKQEAEERERRTQNNRVKNICKIIISHVERYMTRNGYEILSNFQLNANSVRFMFMGQKDGVTFNESIQIRADMIIECYGDENKISGASVSVFRELKSAIIARNSKSSPTPAQKASSVVGFGAWGA